MHCEKKVGTIIWFSISEVSSSEAILVNIFYFSVEPFSQLKTIFSCYSVMLIFGYVAGNQSGVSYRHTLPDTSMLRAVVDAMTVHIRSPDKLIVLIQALADSINKTVPPLNWSTVLTPIMRHQPQGIWKRTEPVLCNFWLAKCILTMTCWAVPWSDRRENFLVNCFHFWSHAFTIFTFVSSFPPRNKALVLQ